MVGQQFEHRDIIIESHSNTLKRISEIPRFYDALQYPLLFTYGDNGVTTIDISQRDPSTKVPLKKQYLQQVFILLG